MLNLVVSGSFTMVSGKAIFSVMSRGRHEYANVTEEQVIELFTEFYLCYQCMQMYNMGDEEETLLELSFSSKPYELMEFERLDVWCKAIPSQLFVCYVRLQVRLCLYVASSSCHYSSSS